MFLSYFAFILALNASFITDGGIADHGFDAELVAGQFPDWTFSGSASFVRDTFHPYDGDSLTIITATSQGDNFFYQDLSAANLTEGKTYWLSFRYKILDSDLTVATGGGARVQLAILGGHDDGVIYAATKPVVTSFGKKWQEAKVAFTARAENSRLSVGMWGASGKIAMDDVRINPMEELEGAALVNPDLESFGDAGPAPFGWTASESGGTISTDSDSITGRTCTRLNRTTSGETALTQTISFPASQITAYKGSIYLKTDEVAEPGCTLRIYQTVTGGTQDLFVSDAFTGDSDWKLLNFAFKTQPDGSSQNRMTIELKLSAQGSCWFDGIELRRIPIMAMDFDDTNWANYWDKTGSGDVSVVNEEGKKRCGIVNETNQTTSISQDFHIPEGIPFSIGGRLQASAIPPEGEEGGLVITVYDNDTSSVVAKLGPITDKTYWEWWHLSVPFKPVENPSANRYTLTISLENCHGSCRISGLNSTIPSVGGMVEVIPQPAQPPRFRPATPVIYGQTMPTYIVYDDSGGAISDLHQIAVDLEEDLTCGKDNPSTLYYYYRMQSNNVQVIPLSNFDPAIHRRAIVLGRVDGTVTSSTRLTRLEALMQGRVDEGEVAARGNEGYVLDIPVDTYPVILILSTGYAGVYYGVQTFLQLIAPPVQTQDEGFTYPVQACLIHDEYDLPIRAVHLSYPVDYKLPVGPFVGLDNDSALAQDNHRKAQLDISLLLPRGGDTRSPVEVYVRLLSRLKINMLVVESPLFYCLDEQNDETKKTNTELMQELFTYCRRFYITPVPTMQSMSYADHLLQFSWLHNGKWHSLWNEVEASWVGGDPASDDPMEPTYEVEYFDYFDPNPDNPTDYGATPMPRPPEAFYAGHGDWHVFRRERVIQTEERPITVEIFRDGDWHEIDPQDPQYPEGANYTIECNPLYFDRVNGYQTTPVAGAEEDKKQNCRIHITGNFAPTRFRLKYHWVCQQRNPNDTVVRFSYCPRSPIIQQFMHEKINQVVALLHPEYIWFGHAEPCQMHTDERCFNVKQEDMPYYPEGEQQIQISPNGKIMADDVHFLITTYEEACVNNGMAKGRAMFEGDHFCAEHESDKVPYWGDYGGDPDYVYSLDWRKYWDYRGNRYRKGDIITLEGRPCQQRLYQAVTPVPETGWVYLSRLQMKAQGHTNAIMAEWSYGVQTGAMTSWSQYRYIQDLTNAGFDVIGCTEGDPRFIGYDTGELGPDQMLNCGAMVWAKLINTNVPNGSKNMDFWSLCELEGSYEEDIKLRYHLDTDPECTQDNNGLWWFSRHFEMKHIPPGQYINKIKLYCGIVGVGAEGEAWFEDVLIERQIAQNRWETYVGANDDDGDVHNYSFEYDGTGGNTFGWWGDPEDPEANKVEVEAVTNYFRRKVDDAVWPDEINHPEHDNRCCHMTSLAGRPTTQETVYFGLLQEFNLPQGQYLGQNSEDVLRIQGYLRAKLVDTRRMVNPYQWMLAGNNFRQGGNNIGKYLGGIAMDWGHALLPYDEDLNIRWKTRVANLAVASYGWNTAYPASGFLKDMWFEPFLILEKEVPW